MVVGGNIVHVRVECSVGSVLFVDVNGYKELAVIFVHVASSVFHSLWRPQVWAVTVVRMVILPAPRVSHLHKPDVLASVIFDRFYAQDSVGMSLWEAYCVEFIMAVTIGAALYDVIFIISLHQFFPKKIFGDPAMVLSCVRSAIEGLNGYSGVTTYDMRVVTVVFGEGFFEDRAVNGRVFWHFGK